MTFHLFICHYGDLFWTEGALAFWSKVELSSVSVSFQKDSVSIRDLSSLERKWKKSLGRGVSLRLHVLQRLPPSHASLQHAQAISELRAVADIRTGHVIVADPDLWVIRPDLFQSRILSLGSGDALFAADHRDTNLSHACLGIMPIIFFSDLKLDLDLHSLKSDFGREWYSRHQEVSPKGSKSILLQPIQTKPWGGYFYSQTGAFHFSSQSFVGSHWMRMSYRPWVTWGRGAPKRFAKKLSRHFQTSSDRARSISSTIRRCNFPAN